MPDPQRFPPDDPREWLNRARSDLALAKRRGEDVYLEDLCFHAQQAAEKAIKAVLIHEGVEFPYIHDIGRLLHMVAQADVAVPTEVWKGETLTHFAVVTRYPGAGRPPSNPDHRKALGSAQAVVAWAERVVIQASGG